jgi:hypothetical protein
MSPQVASTLMWFLRELVRSYLFMNEKDYDDLSPSLQMIFGQDTPCGLVIINFLIKKIYSNFYIWNAENTATSQTAKLLLEIVKNKEMSQVLIHNEKFWLISKIAVENEHPWISLSSNVKKLIIKALIVSCNKSQLTNGSLNEGSMLLHVYYLFNILLRVLNLSSYNTFHI